MYESCKIILKLAKDISLQQTYWQIGKSLFTIDIVLNLDIKRLVEVRHVKCSAKSLCLRC